MNVSDTAWRLWPRSMNYTKTSSAAKTMISVPSLKTNDQLQSFRTLFNTGLPINFVYLCTLFISTRHHPMLQTLSLPEDQSVLVDGFGQPAVSATSNHGWDSNLVSAVSHMLHQPPGTPPPSLQQFTNTDKFKRQLKNCSIWTSVFLYY